MSTFQADISSTDEEDDDDDDDGDTVEGHICFSTFQADVSQQQQWPQAQS